MSELALLVACLHLQRGGAHSYNWLQVHAQWTAFAAKQQRDSIESWPAHTLRAAFARLVAVHLLRYTQPAVADSGGLVERQTAAACLSVRREELEGWLRQAKGVPEWLNNWALKESME